MPSYIDGLERSGTSVLTAFAASTLDVLVLVPDYLKISINENTENYDKQNA